MESPSSSKKRKRNAEDSSRVTFSVAPSTEDVGPVLAIFPAVQPLASTSFQLYREKSHLVPDGTEPHHLLRGETEAIEYTSPTANGDDEDEIACQYAVGVYDKTTRKVRLYRAPTHIMSQSVKALKARAKATPTDQSQYRIARTQLGQTFGSKKAHKAIREAERNQVDISALHGVVGHVQNEIEMGTEGLPSQDEIQATMQSARPIPPVNESAQKVSDVYNIFDVVTEPELKALSIQPFISASNLSERLALLPDRRSEWVVGHIKKLFSVDRVGKLDKPSLKLVVVVSSMLAFRNEAKFHLHKKGAPGEKSGREKVEDRLKHVPDSLKDGLFERFTEIARGKDSPEYTHACDTRLLTYMFSLILRVDRWRTVTATIASDLKMDSPKIINLFKTLGCRRETLTPDQRAELGITSEEHNADKVMILKLPLVFPKPPGRRKAA